jgi:RNA polymerase sigma factor (sigma-70 family)
MTAVVSLRTSQGMVGKKPLTSEEVNHLIQNIRDGDEDALNTMIVRNQGLVAKIVSKYRHRKVPQEDLFQAGMVGMLKAIEKFDPGTGNQFSTFAYPTISGYVLRQLQTDHLVKPSQRMYMTAQSMYARQLQNEPDEVIAEKLEVPLKDVHAARQYLSLGDKPTSLDVAVKADGGESGDLTIKDFLVGDVNPPNWLEQLEVKETLSRLPLREQTVIRLRFYEEKTLEETGAHFGVTRERARQIEVKALKRLKQLLGEEDYMTPSQRKKAKELAIKLYEENPEMTYSDISGETGLPLGSLSGIIRRHRNKVEAAEEKARAKETKRRGRPKKEEKVTKKSTPPKGAKPSVKQPPASCIIIENPSPTNVTKLGNIDITTAAPDGKPGILMMPAVEIKHGEIEESLEVSFKANIGGTKVSVQDFSNKLYEIIEYVQNAGVADVTFSVSMEASHKGEKLKPHE